MTSLRTALIASILVAGLALPIRNTRAAAPVLAVIVNPSNSVDHLSGPELESIFTSSRRYWRNGKNIVAFNYAPNDPYRVAFDKAVLRMTPDQVSSFWINERIRGRQGPPRQIPNASLMVRVIERLDEAIGYAPIEMTRHANVKLVAIIRDGEVKSP